MTRAARYTLEDLLQVAAADGVPVTGRMIVDWVELGLLDQRQHVGLGRGSGSQPGTWPEEQRSLFLLLLKQRQQVRHIATLTNIPVGFWLILGDRYVPLRQVRRALRTWAGGQHVSESAARGAARRLVADFGTKEHVGRGELVECMTDALRGKRPDIDGLRPYMQQLGEGQTLEAEGIALRVTPDVAIRLFSARLAALRSLESFSDAAFHWARYIYNVGRADYGQRLPHLQQHEHFAHMFEDTTLSAILNQACLDLLTTLGISCIGDFDKSRMELDNPLAWEKHDLRMEIIDPGDRPDGLDVEIEIKPADLTS